MKHLRTIAGFLLLPLAASGQAQPQPSHYEIASQPGEIDDTTQAADIRFKQDQHLRMTVPVRLSGSGPYRFLVDTGADHSAISRDLAARLKLRKGAPKTMHSVTGVSEVGTATVPVLDLSVKKLRDLEAAVLEPANIGADGILGLDALRSQRVLFDFKAQTLTVVPSSQRVYEEEGTIVVTARRKKGRLIVTEARAEGTRISVVVDTGSQVSIGNQALRQKLVRAGVVRRQGPVELISVTGEKLIGEYMFVKKLELGGVVLADVAIVFADSHAFKELGLQRKPAIFLGMNVFRAFERVSIDFDRRKLRLVLPEKSSLDGAAMAAG
jgi:predicted aspartyl protease